MLLYLGLVGIGVLFLILVIAYVQARHYYPPPAGPFPRFFVVGTIVLAFSSAVLRPTMRFYRKDNLRRLRQALGYAVGLGVAFIVTQGLGWQELMASGVAPRGAPAGSYIYLLSALHAVHLLAGIGYLTYFWSLTRHAAADGVRALVFIRNPYRQLQLRMLRLYWYFMEAVWLVVFLVLLFTV